MASLADSKLVKRSASGGAIAAETDASGAADLGLLGLALAGAAFDADLAGVAFAIGFAAGLAWDFFAAAGLSGGADAGLAFFAMDGSGL